MKKLLLTSLFVSLFQVYYHAQISSTLSNRLQFVLDSISSNRKIKGVSAAVYIPNYGMWTGTNGVSHTGTPINEDMIFSIASNSKTYISVILLKMAENNLLDLDDTIGTWLPNVQHVNGQITIRQLLNHTSGLSEYTQNPAFASSQFQNLQQIWTPTSLLQFIQAPAGAPGGIFRYSNTNYLLASLIIESVSGTSLSNALDQYIFTPQNYEHSFNMPQSVPGEVIPHAWSIYFSNPQKLRDLNTMPGYSGNSTYSMYHGTGSIFTTASDNAQFMYDLFSGQILNQNSLNELCTGITVSNSIKYGLGIFRHNNFSNGRTIFKHGGTMLGFISENMIDTISNISISVLTNQDSIGNQILMNDLVRALHKAALNPTLNTLSLENQQNQILFTNPAIGTISFYNSSSNPIHGFLIYDLTGKVVLSNQSPEEISEIRTEDLKSGSYFIKFLNANNDLIQTSKVEILD